MSRRLFIAMLGFGLALFLMPQVSLAAEDHIAGAITHTKQAINHGKQGHADVLTTHAKAALTHTEAGEKANRRILRLTYCFSTASPYSHGEVDGCKRRQTPMVPLTTLGATNRLGLRPN